MNKYQIDKTLLSELSALTQHMEKDEDMTISLSKFREYVVPITKATPKTIIPSRYNTV